MAKGLITLGVILIFIGVIGYFIGPISYKNPLDFSVKKENFSFYFPLGTSILISIVLSLFFYFFRK